MTLIKVDARGAELRALRASRLVGITEAAQLVGLTPEQFRGLEHGSWTLSDADWNYVMQMIREVER